MLREKEENQSDPHRIWMSESPGTDTAQLLLSHANWMAVTYVALTLGSFLQSSSFQNEASGLRELSIFSFVFALLMSIWTSYAVASTWYCNAKMERPVFGHAGFAMVFLMALLLVWFSAWNIAFFTTYKVVAP